MAEHSYEQVMTALRNADAAGDTEAATRLASIAQGYKQEPKQTSSFSLERGIQDVPRILKDTAAGMIGAGEAGLNLGLQLPSMAYAALDKLQEGVDIGLDKLGISPYPEQKGRGEERYVKAMEASNYTPRTEVGKENLEVIGKAFNDVGMPILASGLPVGAALGSGLQAVGKGMTKFNAGKTPRTNAAFEEVLREDAAKIQQKPETLSQYPQNVLSDIDAQMQVRPQDLQAPQFGMGGKLSKIEDQVGRERPKFEPGERATQESMDLEQHRLAQETAQESSQKAADIEAAYADREFKGKSAEDIWNEREQRQAILDAPLELEPTQRSQTAPPEDQVPLGQRGFGRGQRGAIDPDVFLKYFPEFVNSKVVNALGKLAQVYHGTTKEIKGAFKTYKGFKNFYKDVGGLDKDGFIRTPERAYSGDIGTWFSSTPKGTDTFAGARTGVKGGNVHPVYLNLKNPKVFETHGDYIKWFNSVTEDGSSASKARRSLIKQGHDGIQIKNSRTDAGGLRTDWVAFHPQQIESTLSPTRPIGQTKVGKSQRGSIDFSFGKKREKQLIAEEEAQTKQIIKELDAHRNANYAQTAISSIKWINKVRPLYDKVQQLQKTLAHGRLPYELVMKMEDAYRDANSLWKDIQVFAHGDPEALHPLGHRLSEDQGRSVAGSNLSRTAKNLPQMEQAFKDYIQGIEEYKKTLNLRSKYDRQIKTELDPILDNVQKLGQTKFGKGQKGSIGFFGKDPFEKFSESIKESYPDATPEQIQRAWDKQQAEQSLPKENRVKQEAIAKAIGNKTNDNLTVYDGSDQPSILSAIASSPDLKDQPGTYQKWFAPKGQIAKELVDNPGVNAGISRIKHITDFFARKSENELFGPQGIITKITKFESPFGPGKISNLFKERFKAKNNPEYKQQLNKFETELDTAIDTLVSKNFEEVSKVFEQKGKEPPKSVYKYFPSLFDGKFVFEVKTNGGKPVLMTAHNKNQYNLMRDLMQAEGLEVGHIRERKALQNRFGDTEHLVAEYQMMLDFMDSSMPEAVAVRNAMEGIEQANAATTAGYQNRFKEYSGYKGNLGNNPFLSDSRNFYDAKKALTRYQEAHNAWLAAHELTAFDKELGNLSNAPSGVTNYLSSQIQDIVIKQRANDLVTPLMDVVQSITGISDTAQMKAVRQYANLNTVRMVGAGSFRALTQNFFQPIEAILPKFLQMYPKVGGGALDIVSPAIHGLGDYFQVLGIHNKNEISGLFNSMQSKKVLETESKIFGVTSNELYQEAVKSGLIDPTVLESTPFLDRKLTQGAWKFGSGLLSRSSEQAARFATFSTFSRWLIDAGLPKEKAILQAKQWTEGHMVDYSVEAKPSVMTNTGILGEAAGRLQTYKATQIGRYVVYIKEMMKSGNTKPLAAMLTVNLMLAGLQGMIGMDVLSTVLDGISSVSNDPKDKEFSFRRWVSEKAPEWANWGVLSTTTGLGLFNAFSQQSIGDGSLANMFPVYAGAAEQGRAVFRRASTDWETENVGEKARQLSAFVPSSLQPRIDRELLTQNVLGKKTAISKFTNQPVYTYQEGDYSVGNISPFEKSKQSSLRNEMRKEGERFTTGKKDLEKELESKAMDIYAYGKKNAFNQKAFDNMIMDFVVGYKGNPEILDKVFKNLAIKSGMTKHELVRLLQMNKVDYEQLPEVNRMLKYSELMEKRK